MLSTDKKNRILKIYLFSWDLLLPVPVVQVSIRDICIKLAMIDMTPFLWEKVFKLYYSSTDAGCMMFRWKV